MAIVPSVFYFTLPVASTSQQNLFAGEHLMKQGDWSEAIKCFTVALHCANQISDQNLRHEQLAAAYTGLGNIYCEIGNLTRSKEYHKKAKGEINLNQNTASKIQHLCISSGNLSNVYFKLGKFDKALEYQQIKLTNAQLIHDESMISSSLFSMGNIQTQRGERQEALRLFDTVIQRCHQQPERSAEALQGKGNVYAEEQRWEEAIQNYNQALHSTKNRDLQILLNNNLGFCKMKQGKAQEAETFLKKAISLINLSLNRIQNQESQVFYFEEHSRTYHMLVDALVAQEKFEEALGVADEAKALALVRSISKSEAPKTSTANRIKLLAKEENTTFLHSTCSFFAPNKLFTWVVSPSGKIHFETITLPNDPQLDALLSGKAFNKRGILEHDPRFVSWNSIANWFKEFIFRDTLRDDLKLWYQHLISPIEPYLPSDPEEVVAWVTDYHLHHMPLSVLIDPEGSYLIEKHTLAIVPSCLALEALKNRKEELLPTRNRHALVVGNPTGDLDGAKSESEAISYMLQAELIQGKNASLDLFKEKIGHANIIHIATHGTSGLKREHSAFSGVVSMADNEDQKPSFFTAEDLDGIKLNAHHVFISACESGKGAIRIEGMMGLGRAFMNAGCDTIISSHWRVPDEETQKLAITFYHHLLGKVDQAPLTTAQSLRKAVLTLLNQDRHNPQKWGAFYVSGLYNEILVHQEPESSKKRHLSNDTQESKRQKGEGKPHSEKV